MKPFHIETKIYGESPDVFQVVTVTFDRSENLVEVDATIQEPLTVVPSDLYTDIFEAMRAEKIAFRLAEIFLLIGPEIKKV